jgi:hypothetical protein
MVLIQVFQQLHQQVVVQVLHGQGQMQIQEDQVVVRETLIQKAQEISHQ